MSDNYDNYDNYDAARERDMETEAMQQEADAAVPACPRCGDQTLWHISRNMLGQLYGWCRLCHHTWDIPEDNPYRKEEATK